LRKPSFGQSIGSAFYKEPKLGQTAGSSDGHFQKKILRLNFSSAKEIFLVLRFFRLTRKMVKGNPKKNCNFRMFFISFHQKKHHTMGHSHEGHCHHHSVSSLENINRAFYIGIGLNLLYTITEFAVGFKINSLALISDASHNLSDVASLGISLIGIILAQKASTHSLTYGYKKASILASLINAILLVFIVFKIIIEAVERLSTPPQMESNGIIITATIGVIINAVSAFLFYKGQKHDINIKGAFLHLMVDALVSVGVIISGVIIYFTGWNLADVVISFIIAVVILISTWGLLTESIKLSLNGVPEGINPNEIQKLIEEIPAVEDTHHLHIWAMSSSENALTVHLVVNEGISFQEMEQIKKELRHKLEHHNIQHSTFEIESSGCKCDQEFCK